MTEQWLPVAGWEGAYEVSDQGRVRSLERTVLRRGHGGKRRVPAKLLTPSPNDKGTMAVGLGNGTRKTTRRQVGRLVLETFVGPCPPGLECCHANDNPADNRLINLRWDTRSANQVDRVHNGNHYNSNKTHCIHGHEFTPENARIVTRANGRTRRQCRACASAAALRSMAKRMVVTPDPS
jgi:hypothetical protein